MADRDKLLRKYVAECINLYPSNVDHPNHVRWSSGKGPLEVRHAVFGADTTIVRETLEEALYECVKGWKRYILRDLDKEIERVKDEIAAAQTKLEVLEAQRAAQDELPEE
jgi:hypothetical protein